MNHNKKKTIVSRTQLGFNQDNNKRSIKITDLTSRNINSTYYLSSLTPSVDLIDQEVYNNGVPKYNYSDLRIKICITTVITSQFQ